MEVGKVYRRGPEEIQALEGVNLKIAAGEFVAITGKSGCGKSTLLHIIGGLEPGGGVGRGPGGGGEVAHRGGPGGPAQPPAAPGLRRRDAAGRHRPGPHQLPGGGPGGRTHGQPGLRHYRQDPGALFPPAPAVAENRGPGEPCPGSRELRFPGFAHAGRPAAVMKPWLFRISLSHLAQRPGRPLLGILGIALGTAVYRSTALAAVSALKSFENGVTAVAGKAQWRLQSPGAPLNEALLAEVRRLPEIKAAAPVVESVLELAGFDGGPVLLLGVDPFSEGPFRDYEFAPGSGLGDAAWIDFLTRPDAVLISDPLRRRLPLTAGDSLPVLGGARRQVLRVAGVFRSPSGLYPLDGSVLLMDLGAAQELLDRVGGLDYIDLRVAGDEAQLPAVLKKVLPPGAEGVRPAAQGSRTQGLVASYRLNLAVLSAIALFVGMFLIYQSVTLSVVRRRREIGLLRTLGMTPGQVLALFLAEGLASGLAGGLLGLGLGVALARGVLAVVAQNLTSLYMPVVAQEVWVRGPLLLQAWGLAIAATLLAALIPAREAARTRVRAGWYREDLEERP